MAESQETYQPETNLTNQAMFVDSMNERCLMLLYEHSKIKEECLAPWQELHGHALDLKGVHVLKQKIDGTPEQRRDTCQ